MKQAKITKPLSYQHVKARVLFAVGKPQTQHILLSVYRIAMCFIQIDQLVKIEQKIRIRARQTDAATEIRAPPQVIAQLRAAQLRVLRHIGKEIDLGARFPLLARQTVGVLPELLVIAVFVFPRINPNLSEQRTLRSVGAFGRRLWLLSDLGMHKALGQGNVHSGVLVDVMRDLSDLYGIGGAR